MEVQYHSRPVHCCHLHCQLLNLVVRKERPDLADLGEQLVEQQNGFKIKMKELEDNILYKLATAEGLPVSEFRVLHLCAIVRN